MGLPDSQFAAETLQSLHRLADVLDIVQNNRLAGYLQQAERLAQSATPAGSNGFRSAIRLCREVIDQDANEVSEVAEISDEYLDRQRAESDRLAQALQHADFAALGKGGHNLKGTGAAYGFAELSDIGKALEMAAKENDPAACGLLLDRIESYLGIVRPLQKDQ